VRVNGKKDNHLKKIATLLLIAAAKKIGMTGRIYFNLSRGPLRQRIMDARMLRINPGRLIIKAKTQIYFMICMSLSSRIMLITTAQSASGRIQFKT
jgi:hypothetical protein